MENGGGFIGIHGSVRDPVYFWDRYVDDLLGARFLAHPMNHQFQTATVRVYDFSHPVAKNLPSSWTLSGEWYSFKNNPRSSGVRVIATLDESTYAPEAFGGRSLRMGDHPIVWSRCIGRGARAGRMLYSPIGHRPELYTDPVNIQMLEQGIGWAAGLNGRVCRSPQ